MSVSHDVTGVTTLVDLLRQRVGEPEDLGLRYLSARDGAITQSLTFAELDARARAVASVLAERFAPGTSALLCYPPGLEFMVGVFGSLYAGMVAVPAYPPRPHKPDARLAGMTRSCQPAVLLTSAELYADRERLTAKMPELEALPWLASDAVALGRGEDWKPGKVGPDDLAILQYTSGSTGDPKGVMLTHRCVLHNIAGISRAMRLGRGSIGVSWLPAFHDMGLIGNLLGVIWYPGRLHVLSPMAVLQDPFRWLEAVSRTRSYVSGGPCFAFEQAVKRITAEQRRQLDLSEWKVAYVGAEPISPRVLDAFAETFAECGFRREHFYPCYGLAESTLMVTGIEQGVGPRVSGFLGTALERDRVEIATPGRALVGCGKPIVDLDVRIVDPQTSRGVAGDRIGEVWVRGPSVAAGYYQRPDATQETFAARLIDDDRPWMRTGDLGFFHEGELFIAGRLKDVLILRGRNYYPQDLEEHVQLAAPLLKPGCGVAFTRDDETGPRLVLVYEAPRQHQVGQGEVFAQARAALAEEFTLELAELVLIRAGTLPRTSSGKVARRETRQRLLSGELDVVEHFRAEPERHAISSTAIPSAPVAASHGKTAVREWLVDRLAKHLRVAPPAIDTDKPFTDYGLDSLALVQLAAELERWLSRPLSPTLLYSAPTINSLVTALVNASTTESQPGEGSAAARDDARVAIIGIGCRFPGAEGPEAFWNLLREGRLAIRDLPEGRWDSAGRTLTTTRGGYLDEVRGFDAGFFSLSPREAPWIDPQHRLLLETAYHALEDAGLPVDRLSGSATGVFVGISSNDYGRLLSDHAGAEMYLATGNAASMAAHRLSYHFDLHGPSVSVDTACSSSLTAVHQACQALRQGDCELALAAGVNLILTPDITEALSRAQMLSASARCRTFDAAADGYVRGEGVGVVVLKPLAQALRDGDPVYAVIEASAINQDGRSNGITAPNGAAQVKLLRQALARAGRKADDIGCIETHGTGTSLGDPIEFDALRDALGSGETPCALGAVKANIGHLEAAAGIAGLIKAALQIHHGAIPPIVGLERVNPLIRLDGSRFHLPREAQDWPAGDRPRLIGVSSFGFGGGNAHVLLSDDGIPKKVASSGNIPESRQVTLVPLSARTEASLREQAVQLSDWLDRHPVHLDEVAYTLAECRPHYSHRLLVRAGDPGELVESLRQWARTGRDARVDTGRVLGEFTGKVAFLFTGQGSAHAGMHRHLERHDVFRAALDRCETALHKLAGWNLREVLGDRDRIEETEYAQPALFAFEFALVEWWRSMGLKPAAVLGHSVGEYVAAVVAGCLSVEDALALLVARGKGMQACTEGAMLACFAAREQVQPTLDRYGDQVSLAAVNGPRQCVLAGPRGVLAAVAMELTEMGMETRHLRVARAFHSRLIEPALVTLREATRTIGAQPPTIPLISNLTGEVMSKAPDADYWSRHARGTVQFETSMHALERLGITHYLEVGPAPVLSRLGATCLPSTHLVWLTSMKAETDDGSELLRSLGRLYLDGVPVRWVSWSPDSRRLHLPGYAFQHRPYWYDELPRASRIVTAPTPEIATEVKPAQDEAWRPCSHWAQRLPRQHPAFDRFPLLVRDAVDAAWSEHSLADAVLLRPEFDRLAGLYVVSAFSRIGWRPTPGETLRVEELATRLGIAEGKHRLFRRILQLASEDGWLELTGDDIQVKTLPPAADASSVHKDLVRRYPEFEVELKLAAHCASHLAEVLRGQVDPLQVLFDGEAGKLTAEIYSRAPVARFYNALLTRAVSRLVESHPAERPLRVLEIGAGTGGTTQAVLPILSTRRTEYVFTDVSSLFLARAKDQFARHENLEFRMLDLETDPVAQGFADAQFDVIIASNVLHATADLRVAVRHATRLLVPGGMMVLLEGTGPRRLLDLIFGLTEGWWKFVDDALRPTYPLLSPEGWRKLLLEEGYDTIVALPEKDQRLPDPDQVVLLARRSVIETPLLPVNGTSTETEGFRLVGAGPLAEALSERVRVSDTSRRVVILPGAVAGDVPAGALMVYHVTLGEWPTAMDSGIVCIDLDPAQSVEMQAMILAEALRDPGRERVVAFRGDQRYVLGRSVPVENVSRETTAAPDIDAPSRASLLAVSPFERRVLVEGYLKRELSRLIGSSLSDEDLDMPVQSLGLDSLMAIQVRNRVESTLGVSLSLVDFLKGLRVRQLVEGIVKQLSPEASASPASSATPEDRKVTSEEHEEIKEAIEREATGTVATEGVSSLTESELDSLLVRLMDQPQDVR